MIVTIDGPAGSGKSTVAKALACELGWVYLDSGAIYRAVTLAAMRADAQMDSAPALCEIARTMRLCLEPDAKGTRVVLDDEDVTAAIRTPEVTAKVHHVATCAQLRQAIIPLQRQFARTGNLVAEGRDMGTVVFPDAERKFYLDASVEERARRRQQELAAKGIQTTVEEVLADMVVRDRSDTTRAAAPLRQADDAVAVDTTRQTIEQVVQALRKHIDKLA